MIKEILHKHAAVGLNNGSVIEGFVQDSDETYFRIVEWDNNLTIVRIDDISFARLSTHSEQPDGQFRPSWSAHPVRPVPPVQPPAETPPVPTMHSVQLDEEGFAIGLPRGTVTMDCPSQAPIDGPDEGSYGQLFTPRTRR